MQAQLELARHKLVSQPEETIDALLDTYSSASKASDVDSRNAAQKLLVQTFDLLGPVRV
eukprot:SAG11_NODE_315_length_10858_cov_14.578977_9_plen_59_part_00